MALASPGVEVKEIDFTATVQVADQNIGVVAIAAQKGHKIGRASCRERV